MTYECRFKVALIGADDNGLPLAYLLTPAGNFIRLADSQEELALAKEDLTACKIDSNRDGSYGMPRITQSTLPDHFENVLSRQINQQRELALAV